jgi:peptide/nickel transport system substrate-binding protein
MDLETSQSPGLTRRELVRAGMLGLSLAGLLAGCGTAGRTASSVGGSAKPARGGTMTVGMLSGGQDETLSVWQANTLPDWARVPNLYDPLFEFGPNGLQPGLAESAEHNARGDVWTFHLRDGVTWHDGKPFTADDVVYTLRNWVSEDNYNSGVAGSIIDPKGVTKRDKLTVDVKLLMPVAELPSFSSYVNAYVVPDGATVKDLAANPVGTGAFKAQSFTAGQRSTFAANKNYWRGAPYVDTLIIDSSFTDETARCNALLAGDVDVVPQVPFTFARLGNPSVRISKSIGASSYMYEMNITKPPFNDVHVRQAMRLLADRPAMINGAIAGFGTPGNDLCGHGLKYFASDLTRERDVEQAQFLLKQAGHEKLTVPLAVSDVAVGLANSAVLYAQQAAEGGVNVQIKSIDPGQYYLASAGYLTRPFSVDYPGGGTAIPSLSQWYLNTTCTGAFGVDNPTHFGDKQDDALLFDAIGETDEAKAAEKWHEVQKIQFDRGGYLVWTDAAYVDAYALTVGGLNATFGGWAKGYLFRYGWVS